MTHTHFCNIRLFVNAGIAFPECKSNARLLDTDKGRLPTTGDLSKVTCPKCKALVAKRFEENERRI